MEFKDRANQLLRDEKLREKYYNSIIAEVDKLDHNSEEFYKLVNEKIQTLFEDAYVNRLSYIFDKSKDAQNLEKRRMLIRLKKFLFESRILVYTGEEFDRLIKQAVAMPFKEIHMTEKWDETYRNMEHPDL